MIRFQPLLVPTLIVLPAVALMTALGVWQLQRLEWKNGLVAAVEARVHAAPMPLADALKFSPEDAEYRIVRVEGHFLHDKEAYLFTTGPDGQPGAHVITPLEQADGTVVLVDRGFVPADRQDPNSRAEGQIAGETSLMGMLRAGQHGGMFIPEPDRAHRVWFVRDAAQISAALGISTIAPVLIDADATPNPGGLPLGGQTMVAFPNNHLSYAWTWFGLALTLVAVYLIYHHSKQRLRFR